MFNLSQPMSGHFIKAQWFKWDKQNKEYKPSRDIQLKGNSNIGVSSGIKETIYTQESAGRWTMKETFRVHVVENFDFSVKDKVYVPFEDKTYIIHRVSYDITHANAISAMMFPNTINVPKVLYLGDS